jgi:hypothetical protein
MVNCRKEEHGSRFDKISLVLTKMIHDIFGLEPVGQASGFEPILQGSV